jgi:hypothetical protein
VLVLSEEADVVDFFSEEEDVEDAIAPGGSCAGETC